jgi:hypothetical protein
LQIERTARRSTFWALAEAPPLRIGLIPVDCKPVTLAE